MTRRRALIFSIVSHVFLLLALIAGGSMQGCSLFQPREEITPISLIGTDDPALGTLDGGKVAAPPQASEADATPAQPEETQASDDPDAIPDPDIEKEKPKPTPPKEKPKPEPKPPEPPKEKPKPAITKGKPVTRQTAKSSAPQEPEKPREDPRLKNMKFVDAKDLGGGSKMLNPAGRTSGEFGSSTGRIGGTGPLGNGGTSLSVDQYIYEAMYAAWDQPKSVPGGTRAKISGTLHRNGSVTHIQLVMPSGNSEFDHSVLTAARRVTFISFPSSMMRDPSFDFVIVYEMKGNPLGSL